MNRIKITISIAAKGIILSKFLPFTLLPSPTTLVGIIVVSIIISVFKLNISLMDAIHVATHIHHIFKDR